MTQSSGNEKMTSTTESDIPVEALTGSLRDYRDIHGTDMLTRVDGFFGWQDLRRQHDLWSYSKSADSAPKTVTSAKNDTGKAISGVNFGSQDYLSLSSHDAIKEAAKAAIDEFGVHSAGSAALLGNTRYSLQLEQVIADFCRKRETVLYPTGWSAGFGVVQGLVRANDHVLMDILTHSCLQEGALAATRNIHFHGHLNVEGARRKLKKIRANDARNAILVVTESTFSMHSGYSRIWPRCSKSAENTTRRFWSTSPTISVASAKPGTATLVSRTCWTMSTSWSAASPKPSPRTVGSWRRTPVR